MDKPIVSEFCVYAIRHTDNLEAKFQAGGKGIFIEGRRWVTGSKLFDKAEREHKQMLVVFGRAEMDSALIFYATLKAVHVDDKKKPPLIILRA